MSFVKKIGLAILSGLLLGAAWFSPFTFLIFIAWVPLLVLTHKIQNSDNKKPGRAVFFYAYIAFLTWNAFDTWWTWFASPGGAVFAIMTNALLMALAYLIYFSLYRSLIAKYSSLTVWLLIPVWLSFEYAHGSWELAWNWLNLGNVFSYQPKWIQWYEFTGVSGGTLWALAVNILLAKIFTSEILNFKSYILRVAAVVLLPLALSFLLFPSSKKEKAKGQNIVIVQPNIDPYNDKFYVAYQTQLLQVYDQLKGKLTQETDYLVLPETFFTENVWENNLEESFSMRFLRDSILAKYPKLIIITGASTYYRFGPNEKLSPTARKFSDAELYYDSYNTGIQLDNFGKALIYHKSKLVPGVERMPYPAFFKPLEKLTIDLGGTSGSLGLQDERDVFFNKDKTVGIAPVICFESVFGEYVTDYIKKGANLIFIITNDGWWRDSPGKTQHLNYARLRAIETRRPIARCANTGISCFITEAGELYNVTEWWQPAVISKTVKPNNEITFYVKFGDLISKVSLVLLLAAILMAIILRAKRSRVRVWSAPSE